MPRLRRAAALVAAALALPAAAAEKPAEQPAPASDPMAGWKPPVVKHEARDRKELEALFARMEQASRKGDLAAAASIIDFPVLMATDDSKGEATSVSWDRAEWEKQMAPYYAQPSAAVIRHRPTVFLITDSLAFVGDDWTMTIAGKPAKGRNATLLVRKGGEWKVKAMIEGGWGDAPEPAPASAPAEGGAPEAKPRP